MAIFINGIAYLHMRKINTPKPPQCINGLPTRRHSGTRGLRRARVQSQPGYSGSSPVGCEKAPSGQSRTGVAGWAPPWSTACAGRHPLCQPVKMFIICNTIHCNYQFCSQVCFLFISQSFPKHVYSFLRKCFILFMVLFHMKSKSAQVTTSHSLSLNTIISINGTFPK